ncbi:MAG: PqqD family protein [Hyphomicrobiaceae bacterium]
MTSETTPASASPSAYRLVPSVMTSSVGREMVLLDTDNGIYFGIDEVGARIWALLAEGHGIAAISGRITAEYEVEPDIAERDVRDFVGELIAKGLVEPKP